MGKILAAVVVAMVLAACGEGRPAPMPQGGDAGEADAGPAARQCYFGRLDAYPGDVHSCALSRDGTLVDCQECRVCPRGSCLSGVCVCDL